MLQPAVSMHSMNMAFTHGMLLPAHLSSNRQVAVYQISMEGKTGFSEGNLLEQRITSSNNSTTLSINTSENKPLVINLLALYIYKECYFFCENHVYSQYNYYI